MALPIPLLLLLYPLLSAFGRIVTGAITAGLVYALLTNTVRPYMENLSSEIVARTSDFSTVGSTALQVVQYLDFGNCISLLLAASTACFSLKVMSVAIRAFGINTGS